MPWSADLAMSLDQHIFQLTCLISARDIRLSARTEVRNRQLLALVIGSGDLMLYYLSGETGQLPIMRRVPWYNDSNKRIMALCFDPSGNWLLAAGYDGSVFIVPALSLVDPNAALDHRWSTTDVMCFPSNLRVEQSHPTAIVWWQILLEGQHVAIMGTHHGDVIFISLTSGLQVGISYVRAAISTLHICQDNNLDSVFLLITSMNRSQWKLLLEQRATGYAWPIDSSGSTVKVATSNSEMSSDSHNSLDLYFSNKNISHLPAGRSRLQGLKQLSVEKITNLRQRLAETRSKGSAVKTEIPNLRRESSSSSSDDTTNGNPGLEGSPSHHVTTGPQPEKLSLQVGDTFLCPQFAKGKYLLSGYYIPTSILTIHGMNLDVVPLTVHKLAPHSRDVLVTDKFLYITDADKKSLSIVSSQLSEGRLDGESEYNAESVLETYEMKGENERILAVYKLTAVHGDKEHKTRGSSKEKKTSQPSFSLPKSVKDLKLDAPAIDTCVVVTNAGVYQVSLQISPTEVFMDLVLTQQALDKAEKLALAFGLNLQQLLEAAGDLKLQAKEFLQAIALYRLSRCRHLKSVLKFATAGHASELLSYITMLFTTSGIDLTNSERIHLSNLAVLSYTEQVLRAVTGKVILLKQFLKFLRENLHYDEVLAVNVAGQTGLWEVLQFLASYRGLHPEVLDILAKIVRSLGESLAKAVEVKDYRNLPALDSGLWLCVSDPSLLQSLLAKPQQAKVHLQYVRTCLPHLEQFALQRLAALYDPSSPQLRPGLKKMYDSSRKRESSTGSCEPADIIQTFLLVLLYLARKRQQMSNKYSPELMEKIQLPKEDDDDEDCNELCPSLPVHTCSLSAGFSHVALIRNGTVYTWGNAVQGCLGSGPLMSRYSCPQQISILPNFKLEIINVSCGRQHTLALTNNGVYSWGASQFGQLGIGKTGQSPYPRLVEQLCSERIIAVAAGQYHSIALADDGRVFTWGWGVHGQLGHNSIEDCHTPCLVERLIGKVVIAICGGHGHTAVLTAEGQVYTFGSSVFGQLGNGSNAKSSVPVHVSSLTERITMIATGYFHNLALSSSNKLYVWGSSPQVLRLQAQAQKKARLLQQQLPSPSHIPSSPSKHRAQVREPDIPFPDPVFIESEPEAISSQAELPVSLENVDVPQKTFSVDEKESTNSSATVPDSRRLDLQVKPLTTDMAALIVSPTMEFKGLTARQSPSHDTVESKSSSEARKAVVQEDVQPHLSPQAVDTSLVVGPITQISCGCHHSALLTREGVLYMWGRNLDGQLGNGTRKEVLIPTPLSNPPVASAATAGTSAKNSSSSSSSLVGMVSSGEKLRFRQVSCGCEFTVAQESSQGGKVWAWGNNSQAQLGYAPVEESKPLDGKYVMVKATKRVIKLPHGTQNSSDVPREVPSLPISTISFKYNNLSGVGGWYENWVGASTVVCPPICSIEEPCYGLRTLHFAFQHFHGYFDSPYLLNKCLELENYQAAAKLAALDRHYHLALSYQLKALALTTVESEKYVYRQSTNLNQKISSISREYVKTISTTDENRKASTNSNLSNGAKDTNSNPLIDPRASITNGNCNRNVNETQHVENRNKRNSEVHFNFTSINTTEENQTGDNAKEEIVTVDTKAPEPSEIKTDEVDTSSSISTPESLVSTNAPDNEMHTFAVQGGTEQMSEGHRYLTSPDSSTSPLASEEPSLASTPQPTQESSTNECVDLIPISVSAVNSTSDNRDSEPTGQNVTNKTELNDNSNVTSVKTNNVSDMKDEKDSVNKFESLIICNGNSSKTETETITCDNENKIRGKESVLGVSQDVKSGFENQVSQENSVKNGARQVESDCSDKMNLENYENELKDCDKAVADTATTSENALGAESSETVQDSSVQQDCDVVGQAAVIVEYYVSVMEEDSHAMMSRLLQQGIEFWLSHSLPVDHLENLLLKHMSKFFYPLGLLLFCKDGSSQEKKQEAVSVLNHLSTRFCLQLCSNLLSHIDQKKAYPEYIELLAQITSMQAAPGINGCCVTNQGLVQSPEQLMEAILEGLGAIKGLGQPFINIQGEAPESSSEAARLEQLLVFSCGHRYGQSVFHQSVLPELELGLLQLHHPLPNTARVLKGLFDSNSPNLHLACPRCVLGYLQSQTTLPL